MAKLAVSNKYIKIRLQGCYSYIGTRFNLGNNKHHKQPETVIVYSKFCDYYTNVTPNYPDIITMIM